MSLKKAFDKAFKTQPIREVEGPFVSVSEEEALEMFGLSEDTETTQTTRKAPLAPITVEGLKKITMEEIEYANCWNNHVVRLLPLLINLDEVLLEEFKTVLTKDIRSNRDTSILAREAAIYDLMQDDRNKFPFEWIASEFELEEDQELYEKGKYSLHMDKNGRILSSYSYACFCYYISLSLGIEGYPRPF